MIDREEVQTAITTSDDFVTRAIASQQDEGEALHEWLTAHDMDAAAILSFGETLTAAILRSGVELTPAEYACTHNAAVVGLVLGVLAGRQESANVVAFQQRREP